MEELPEVDVVGTEDPGHEPLDIDFRERSVWGRVVVLYVRAGRGELGSQSLSQPHEKNLIVFLPLH